MSIEPVMTAYLIVGMCLWLVLRKSYLHPANGWPGAVGAIMIPVAIILFWPILLGVVVATGIAAMRPTRHPTSCL